MRGLSVRCALRGLLLALERDEDSAECWRKAAAHEKAAARRGDANAMYLLGLMHARGRGAERSGEAAVTWWQKAAEHGDARAAKALEWLRKPFGKQLFHFPSAGEKKLTE